VPSHEALFRQEQEIVLENIDLSIEILAFISDSKNDNLEARTYLNHGDTMKTYNFQNMMLMPSVDGCQIQINDYHYNKVERNLKAFRTEVVQRIQKQGDALMGYTVLSTQDQLFDILNELHLHQHINYDDHKVKHYARYFFKKLCEKSREIMAEKLIQDFDIKDDIKDGKLKHDKKQGKKNRKKKNRNKKRDNGNTGQGSQDQEAKQQPGAEKDPQAVADVSSNVINKVQL
jgi:hypothetical protein